MNAIEALELSRSKRRRRTRMMVGFIAACGSIAAMMTFQFGERGANMSYGQVKAQAAPTTGTAVHAAIKPPASVAANIATETKTRPAAGKTLMLTISAVKPCWVRTVVDGTQQMERVLQPGQTVMLHATDEVLLRVGDAAAVSLLINNRAAKALGRSGEVVTRLVTRANYSSFLDPQ